MYDADDEQHILITQLPLILATIGKTVPQARVDAQSAFIFVKESPVKKITRIGIDGPVGSGKTAIIVVITPILINRGYKPLIITNRATNTNTGNLFHRTFLNKNES